MKASRKSFTCAQVKELLFEFIDGELTEAEKSSVDVHLAECEACRRECEEAREMLATVKTCAEEPPKSLYSGVMAKVAETEQDEKIIVKKRRFIPYGTIAAACAAVMILVVGRHAIFGGTVADLTTENDAAEIGDTHVMYSVTNEDKDDRSTEYATKEAVNVKAYAVESDLVEVTTSAMSVYAPSFSTSPADAPSKGLTGNVSEDNIQYGGMNTKAAIIVDAVFSMLDIADNAVIVCFESEFGCELPESYESMTVNGCDIHHYTESGSANESYVYYLETLTEDGVYWRSSFPTSGKFSVCELYLINDTEK